MGQTMLKNVLPSIYAKQNASRKNIHHISKSNKKVEKYFCISPAPEKLFAKPVKLVSRLRQARARASANKRD